MKKIAFVLALMASSSAFASVKGGKFGMDFSFSGSLGLWRTGGVSSANPPSFNGMPTVGFWYHITDMIAVAPSAGFYTTSGTDNTNNTAATAVKSTEYSTTAWGLGIEVPIYLLKLSALDFFVAPGFGFTPTSTTTKINRVNGVAQNGDDSKSTGSYWSVYAAVGLQVPINDQLHVFGKTTIGYASGTTNVDTNANPSEPDDKASYFGLQRWAVGALFYFN